VGVLGAGIDIVYYMSLGAGHSWLVAQAVCARNNIHFNGAENIFTPVPPVKQWRVLPNQPCIVDNDLVTNFKNTG
jgi:hypothetical protein